MKFNLVWAERENFLLTNTLVEIVLVMLDANLTNLKSQNLMDIGNKTVVAKFYLRQHINRAAIKKYGSLQALAAKQAEKTQKQAEKKSEKAMRVDALNLALKSAGPGDVTLVASQKKKAMTRRFVTGAEDDEEFGDKVWRFLSSGKVTTRKRKSSSKPTDSADEPAASDAVRRQRKAPERFVAGPSSKSEGAAAAPSLTVSTIPKPAINTMIEMFWPEDKRWYEAQVVDWCVGL